jgi:hypothetical protein
MIGLRSFNRQVIRQFWVPVLLSVCIVAIFASWRTTKVFVNGSTVKVTGATGHPLANLRVSESWDAYSYDLEGGLDMRTDANGIATFPAQSSTHSVLFWALRPVYTRLNYGVHASTGITAYVGVSEPGLHKEAGDIIGFSCRDDECIDHPLEFEAKLSSK